MGLGNWDQSCNTSSAGFCSSGNRCSKETGLLGLVASMLQVRHSRQLGSHWRLPGADWRNSEQISIVAI